ncbi:MAG: SMC-Scp complex subunit ScpB [Candidatus Micrarchaeia archaeon]
MEEQTTEKNNEETKLKEIEQERLIAEPNAANLEQKIEAILFMAAKAVSITDLQKLTNADLYSIKEAVSNLQHWYTSRKSWLEIVKVDKSYLMRLKPEYTELVSPIVQETELSKRAIRVLAVVAKNNGILQSKIVKMLGTSVYDAVAELKQKGYIVTETKGHSKILKLTQKFKNYFGEIPL